LAGGHSAARSRIARGDFAGIYYHLATDHNIRRWIRVAACRSPDECEARTGYQHSLMLAANILFLLWKLFDRDNVSIDD
jgi:hypothetical protein